MGIFAKGTSEEIRKNGISKKEKKKFKKEYKRPLLLLKTTGISVQDESISVHDLYIRRKWIITQKMPVVTVTGSHSKTILFFGVLSRDSKQLFRQ